jgi:aspartate kinase
MSSKGTANGPLDAPSIVSNAPQDDSVSRSWVVQKFGGTSVGKFALNIAEDIVR